jgi:hypothetical protein
MKPPESLVSDASAILGFSGRCVGIHAWACRDLALESNLSQEAAAGLEEPVFTRNRQEG